MPSLPSVIRIPIEPKGNKRPVSPKSGHESLCGWNLRNYAGEQATGTEQPTEPKLTTDGREVQMFSLLLRVLPPE